jgi:TRAP-type C4-dicarboxylate transport system permease small subunit
MNNFFKAIGNKLQFFSGFIVIAMMILMVLDVIARYVLNTGIPDTIEISSMLLGAVTCLALASVTEKNEHMQFVMVIDALGPRPKRFAAVLTLLISIAIFCMLTFQATVRAIENFKTGEFIGAFQIPMWPTRMLFAFGCLLTVMVLVSQLIAKFTRKEEC